MRSKLRLAVLLSGLSLIASARSAAALDTDYLFEWGSFGPGAGQFSAPSSVALGPSGDVYVLDQGNNRIQKFDAEGQFLTQWVSPRPYLGALQSLAVGFDGSVYVQANHYVQKFDADGTSLFYWGPTGGSSAQLHELTIDDLGDVCVTYWIHGASSTARYSPAGALLGLAFGAGFQYSATVFDSDGNAFYSATPSGTPVIFRRTSGAVLTQWPTPSTRLAVDVLRNLYATHLAGNVVRVFDNAGAPITTFGSPGSGPGQFNGPLGVAVSPGGRIYVADRNNHRIQVFGSAAVPARAISWGRVKAGYR